MFGSTAYVHVPREERGKLDPKIRKCTLVRYGNMQKGYRVYDQATRKIFYSRNVKFDEQEPEGPRFEEERHVDQPLILNSLNKAESDDGGVEEGIKTGAGPPTTEPPPQRTTRERRPVEYYGFPQAHITVHQEPASFEEATACPEGERWRVVMGREMESLKEHEVWEMTTLLPGKKAVGSKWVYKVKTNSDGSLKRYKARLVARGFDQRYSSDYDETFCPVVQLESLRTLIALSTQRTSVLSNGRHVGRCSDKGICSTTILDSARKGWDCSASDLHWN